MTAETQTGEAGAQAAGFRVQRPVVDSGTNGHSNNHTVQSGAPTDSYHMRKFGYFGVQRSDVARDANGWRTYEEQR